MTKDFDRDGYRFVQELQKLQKENIELALKSLSDFRSSTEVHEEVQRKVSNAQSLLEDVKDHYEERLEMTYEEVKEVQDYELDSD